MCISTYSGSVPPFVFPKRNAASAKRQMVKCRRLTSDAVFRLVWLSLDQHTCFWRLPGSRRARRSRYPPLSLSYPGPSIRNQPHPSWCSHPSWCRYKLVQKRRTRLSVIHAARMFLSIDSLPRRITGI